jgi:hypothetical protein
LIDGAVVADLGGLANHYTKPVIDKYATTNGCPRVDFDARQDPTQV